MFVRERRLIYPRQHIEEKIKNSITFICKMLKSQNRVLLKNLLITSQNTPINLCIIIK